MSTTRPAGAGIHSLAELDDCIVAGAGGASEGALPVPTREEVEAAVRTLILWAGDDPRRAGLVDTPSRVARAFMEWFAGYGHDPVGIMSRTFDEIDGYTGAVLLEGVRFRSCCEHHLAPIHGTAHVAYIPSGRVVGISKIARVVDALARRLQIQERMTRQIAVAISQALEPKGVAVVVEATHDCMTSRGIRSLESTMVTKCFLGAYERDHHLRQEFLASLRPLAAR